jgi:hypothetical protein
MWAKVIEFLTNVLVATDSKQQTVPVTVPHPVTGFIDYGHEAGKLACKYETGGKGPGYISNGASWGDPGGDSYGSYQLETKQGTMQAYLNTVNDRFTTALKRYEINSADFRSAWESLAAADPNGFEQSQFYYLANKPNGHYDAVHYAQGLGWNVNNLAMQSAIFSTSNQSGGWKKIFTTAGIKPIDSIETQITKLYTARAEYFKVLNLSSTIKNNIIKSRCGFVLENGALFPLNSENERVDCLKLISEQLF